MAIKTTHAGFTLVELMVTIAVLAIIVTMAAPNMSQTLANQRVKNTTTTIESVLKEAKAESLIRRQNITVEPIREDSTDPSSRIKEFKLKAGATDIVTYGVNGRSDVTVSIAPTSVTSVVFTPAKRVQGITSVTYTICDSGSTDETPRQVTVNEIGTINTQQAGSC